MREMRMTVLLLLLLALPGLVQAKQDNPWEQKLPFKEATITYALSGMADGSEVLYIRDYGRSTAKYHTTMTSMLGMKMEEKTVTIEDPEWIYTYDLKEGTGTKAANPKRYMQEEYEKLSRAEKEQVRKNGEEMGVNMMQGMGGAIEQNAAEMFGFNCDKTSAMGTTVYSIHNTPIVLKSESSMMGVNMSIVATSVDQGGVDDKHFAHPEGIEAVFDQEADQMARSMARQTIAWLKDPEAAKNAPPMAAPASGTRQQDIPPEDQEMMKQAEEMMKGLFGN